MTTGEQQKPYLLSFDPESSSDIFFPFQEEYTAAGHLLPLYARPADRRNRRIDTETRRMRTAPVGRQGYGAILV
jgi:hypothetical protein